MQWRVGNRMAAAPMPRLFVESNGTTLRSQMINCPQPRHVSRAGPSGDFAGVVIGERGPAATWRRSTFTRSSKRPRNMALCPPSEWPITPMRCGSTCGMTGADRRIACDLDAEHCAGRVPGIGEITGIIAKRWIVGAKHDIAPAGQVPGRIRGWVFLARHISPLPSVDVGCNASMAGNFSPDGAGLEGKGKPVCDGSPFVDELYRLSGGSIQFHFLRDLDVQRRKIGAIGKRTRRRPQIPLDISAGGAANLPASVLDFRGLDRRDTPVRESDSRRLCLGGGMGAIFASSLPPYDSLQQRRGPAIQ